MPLLQTDDLFSRRWNDPDENTERQISRGSARNHGACRAHYHTDALFASGPYRPGSAGPGADCGRTGPSPGRHPVSESLSRIRARRRGRTGAPGHPAGRSFAGHFAAGICTRRDGPGTGSWPRSRPPRFAALARAHRTGYRQPGTGRLPPENPLRFVHGRRRGRRDARSLPRCPWRIRASRRMVSPQLSTGSDARGQCRPPGRVASPSSHGGEGAGSARRGRSADGRSRHSQSE